MSGGNEGPAHGAAGRTHAGHGHTAHGHDHAHDLRYFPADAQPEVLPAEAELRFPQPAGQAEVEAVLTEFLAALAAGLAEVGCVLVGHIKGVVVMASGDELAFSLTSLDGAPSFTGVLRGAVRDAALTLNVIVFGVDADALPGLVAGAWPEAAPAIWRTL